MYKIIVLSNVIDLTKTYSLIILQNPSLSIGVFAPFFFNDVIGFNKEELIINTNYIIL